MRRQILETPSPVTARPLHISEVDRLEPSEGEIVIDVAACGVCRTDLQIIEGDLAARVLPVVPGPPSGWARRGVWERALLGLVGGGAGRGRVAGRRVWIV